MIRADLRSRLTAGDLQLVVLLLSGSSTAGPLPAGLIHIEVLLT